MPRQIWQLSFMDTPTSWTAWLQSGARPYVYVRGSLGLLEFLEEFVLIHAFRHAIRLRALAAGELREALLK